MKLYVGQARSNHLVKFSLKRVSTKARILQKVAIKKYKIYFKLFCYIFQHRCKIRMYPLLSTLSKLFHLHNIDKSCLKQMQLVHGFVTSRLEYCNSLLSACLMKSIKTLQLVQNAATCILTRTLSLSLRFLKFPFFPHSLLLVIWDSGALSSSLI